MIWRLQLERDRDTLDIFQAPFPLVEQYFVLLEGPGRERRRDGLWFRSRPFPTSLCWAGLVPRLFPHSGNNGGQCKAGRRRVRTQQGRRCPHRHFPSGESSGLLEVWFTCRPTTDEVCLETPEASWGECMWDGVSQVYSVVHNSCYNVGHFRSVKD